MLSEIIQAQKIKYFMISFICRIKKVEHGEVKNRMAVTRGWGEWGGMGKGKLIGIKAQ